MSVEHKIGEVFTAGKKKYIVSTSPDGTCNGCSIREDVGIHYLCFKCRSEIGPCSALDRKDRKSVIFVEVSDVQNATESVEGGE